jgi:predicted PurR-regulated permease PerM
VVLAATVVVLARMHLAAPVFNPIFFALVFDLIFARVYTWLRRRLPTGVALAYAVPAATGLLLIESRLADQVVALVG